MIKQIRAFNELADSAGNYLEQELGYALKTSANYRRVWRQLREFMFTNGIDTYNESVEQHFLHFKFGNKPKKDLTTNQSETYNGLKMLTEFKRTGKISVPARPSRYPLHFRGDIGKIITQFLQDKKQSNPSRNTYHNYQRHLFEFMVYCEKQGISKVTEIDLSVLLHFINQYDTSKRTVVILAISTARIFMKYLFERNYLDIDYSQKIPRHKSAQQPKIPSNYTKEEVEKLIASVDRTSSIGKRNYVIILIAARLGLRASDISRLKFEHLKWENNTIVMPQYKTGKELVLPLLPDVGNAIIDYLKHGRPESKEPYILLMGRPPYGRFTTSNVVTHVVQRAMRKAGINTKGRRFGAHALRHSLGLRLLENSIALPVISEVLGHQDTSSTKYYLRIDLTSMQQCVLDVPPVATDFYLQKGGKFYG